MISTTNIHDGDLWTETVRALGIRTSGKLSPFRTLETRDEALAMIRDCSVALLLVGLVQASLASFAGVGTAADALVYMPLAVALYRYTSRLAAVLLLAVALFAVTVTVVASWWAIEARTDLILIATLLWAGVRAVEATGRLGVVASPASRAREAADGSSSRSSGARRGHRRGWLVFGGFAFALVLVAKFVVPLARQPIVVAKPVAPPRALPARKAERPAPPVDDLRMRFSPPTGFIEPRLEEPEIGTMAEAFVPPAMELGALFVTAADLESFRHEHRFSPPRYVMVQTARGAADRRISGDAFRTAKAAKPGANVVELERLMGGDAAISQWLDAAMRPAGITSELDGARVRSEGVLDETDRSISLASVVEVAASKAAPATSRAVITSLVLARGRVLIVYTYGAYTKPDDLAATNTIARDVVHNLIHENPA